jgi:hypothetical protein
MHFDQNIIFIIIAAIVGISRLIARIAEQSKKQQQNRQPPAPGRPRPEYTQTVQRTQPKTDQERVREFLEALGQPPGTAPPPKVQPRTQVPPRPLAPVQPPGSTRPLARPKFRTWKEQMKEIVVLQQPAESAPPTIKRVVVPSAPPAVPVEANEPGAWMTEEQGQVVPVAPKTAAAVPTDYPVRRTTVETLWKQNLRSPDSLRTAIILREIFGPARGLQDLGT